MSTDFSVRPVGIPAPAPIAPTPTPAAAQGVSTELPPRQAVTAPEAAADVRNDIPENEDVSHQVVFDRAAASFVFQVVNQKNDAVVTQFPDDAMLRRRAYFRALDLGKSEAGSPQSTDRKI